MKVWLFFIKAIIEFYLFLRCYSNKNITKLLKMSEKEMLLRSATDASLQTWRTDEMMALELLRIVGELRFDRGVEIVFFRSDIYDCRPSELMNILLKSENYVKQEVSVKLALELVRAIADVPGLVPAKIDLGRMSVEWLESGKKDNEIHSFVGDRLATFQGENTSRVSKDVVLYGFGRIGRLLARRIISMTGKGQQLRLKAIVLRPKMKNVREELEKRASLLQSDSVHGDFHGVVEVTGDDELTINGNKIKVIFAGSPAEIDYTKYGIQDAVLIDNTGVWRDKEGLSGHLRPGIEKVMLTAPGKDISNIVHGVNQHTLNLDEEKVISAASCTTNAISPVLKVLNESFGVEKGHIETIHAYTSDQNLLDNFHKKPRRGRAAAVNMVLTSTGAASAVGKVLPELNGILTGNAVRVPTPNVSLAILNLSLKKETTVEELNELIRQKSLFSELVEQLEYSTSSEFVSTNAIGMTATSIFDAPSTIVSPDGKSATIYVWYDNEYGYTCQVVRLAKYFAGVRRKVYY